MADLSTTYLGLRLRNPVIAASSRMTGSVDGLVEFERAGAGAVVLKSLFEEQIVSDVGTMVGSLDPHLHSEAADLFRGSGKSYYLNEYLRLVREAKAALSIPVIASVNCVSDGTWLEYAKELENAGADGLELNVFILPSDRRTDPRNTEKRYVDICRKVKERVSVPVAMKIGTYFSGLAGMIHSLADAGANGLVLFNRFYRPDVDIEKMKVVAAPILSVPEEMNLSLQWIALLSGEISCDLCAATGVHDGAGAIKQLLVGARAVQACSAFFRYGKDRLSSMLSDLESWMARHGFGTIDDFRGSLAQEGSEDPGIYERSQYIKALVGIS